MNIELKALTIGDVVAGYSDSAEEGVKGYGGRLDIRPAYQREFIYKGKQRDEVIRTIRKGFPLNVMYWIKTGKDSYEVLDGQQRTISFCQYVNGDFSINYQYFDNLTKKEQEEILNYPLMVYVCEGSDREKLDWFQVVNIAGERLYDQEIRNAVYTGEWLNDAKQHFSKTGCAAYGLGKDYIKGSPIRQDYLETVLKWIADRDDIRIEDYMAIHQHDSNCSEIWVYFQNVINWIRVIFPEYKKEMKGVDWGRLYNSYHNQSFDPVILKEKVEELLEDEDVTKKSGIFEYLLSGDERALNIRAFSAKMKREAYQRQNGVCTICHKHFNFNEMEADHITPWSNGGRTISENCQVLCKSCNRRKGNK